MNIQKILERYETEILKPRLGDTPIAKELLQNLETLLSEEAKIQMELQNTVGDIQFNAKEYTIGIPPKITKSSTTKKAEVLAYLLEHLGESTSNETLRQLTGLKAETINRYILKLRDEIIYGSTCFQLRKFGSQSYILKKIT